jgi:multisubunit Na+/H+ antiporter MnhF subunit
VTREQLGRRLLRFDALYCAGAGAITVALCAPFARLFHIPVAVPAAAGAATLVWALALARLARGDSWRGAVAGVAGANVVAAAALAVLAVVAPVLAGQLLLAAVALEVGGFGAGQFLALRR